VGLARPQRSAAALSQLRELRAFLEAYGKRSERGKSSVANLLKVLDALEATTDAEYHQKLLELPVIIRRSGAVDADGRPGTRTEYLHKGVVRGTVFKVDAIDPTSGMSQAAESPQEGPSGSDGLAAFPPFAGSYDVATTTCTYTDEDNITWTGECATQQEMDEAWAVALSLEEDVYGVQAETNGFSYEYCQSYPTDCWDQEAALSGMRRTSFGGPRLTFEDILLGPCYAQAGAYALRSGPGFLNR
jgi:hypothetical protein